jgi:hypothetical protein
MNHQSARTRVHSSQLRPPYHHLSNQSSLLLHTDTYMHDDSQDALGDAHRSQDVVLAALKPKPKKRTGKVFMDIPRVCQLEERGQIWSPSLYGRQR